MLGVSRDRRTATAGGPLRPGGSDDVPRDIENVANMVRAVDGATSARDAFSRACAAITEASDFGYGAVWMFDEGGTPDLVSETGAIAPLRAEKHTPGRRRHPVRPCVPGP